MYTATPLAPGTKVGADYVIESCLGVGGFGITYRAMDYALKIPVALKEYYPQSIAYRDERNHVLPRIGPADGESHEAPLERVFAKASTNHYKASASALRGGYVSVDDSTQILGAPEGATTLADVFRWGLDRFVQEANLLAILNHRNVVRVFRIFRDNETAYMALELVDGPDLSAMARNKKFSQDDVDRLTPSLLDALELFHANGIIHRDIKPANIMLRSKDGSPVLLDFGSAHVIAAGGMSPILTPAFAPIEQYTSKASDIGPWTDIYGLTATIHCLITGSPPKEATERVAQDVQPPLIARPDLKDYRRQFLKAVDWGLAVLPKDRPQKVGDLRSMLLPTLEGSLGSKIFISYRRSDTRHVAGRVFDRLTQEFGEAAVFFDVDRIPFGVDFRSHIKETLKECAIVIALVGPEWKGIDWGRKGRGWMFWRSRKDDFVEIEISLALKSGVPILPILIDGTTMPAANSVPESIAEFVYLNALVLRSGRDFRIDIERIIANLSARPSLQLSATADKRPSFVSATSVPDGTAQASPQDQMPQIKAWRLRGVSENGELIDYKIVGENDSGGELTIGRDVSRCDLVLNDPSVSKVHARLRYFPGRGLGVCDLCSPSGTFMDGKGVGQDYVFPIFDSGENRFHELQIGRVRLTIGAVQDLQQ